MSRKYESRAQAGCDSHGLARRAFPAEVEPRPGLSVGITSCWKKQLKDKGGEVFPGTGHLIDRDEEVRRLRRVS